ncbi:MAG: carboxymuconolactone decarboxylase family protein, partial [Syntrophaceae bacterium]|nr:carboxymuconolactone decarboxylase family protein [Syntrophaceae bacterium]
AAGRLVQKGNILNGQKLRHFKSPAEFFNLFSSLLRAMPLTKIARFKKAIYPAFSERIALAVSGVTNCAYCTWLHTKTSLEKGMSEKEIKSLLDGDIKDAPQQEAPALFYVQHRADFDGGFSPEARQRIVDFYGEEKAGHIDFMFQTVYFGNLCSNTVYSVQNNMAQGEKDFKLRLAYFLSLPVAYFIRKGSK